MNSINDNHHLVEMNASTIAQENSFPDEKLIEIRLRVLHDILYEAMNFPGFASPYTNFLRSLRERIHPVGIKEICLAEMDSGVRFQVNLGDRLGCDIYYGYYQEYFDSQLFFSLVDSGSTVIDIGANFGYYAVTAATLTGSEGTILAFEPNEEAYNLLKNNVEINGVQQTVHCHPVCVGAEDGETDFYVSEESSFSGMTSTGRSKLLDKVRVPLCSLDSLLPKLGLSEIDAIKIDVEGYEFSVLCGAMETLRKSPNVIIMLEVSAKNLDEQRQEALISALIDVYELGFRAWVVDSTPENLRLLTTPQAAASLGSSNLFLTKSGSEQEQRLQNSYKDLQIKGFRGIAKGMGLPAEKLLHRNASDPQAYSKIHGALLDRLLRDRNAIIDDLQSKAQRLEKDNQKKLQEIHNQNQQLTESQAQILRLEQESQEKLHQQEQQLTDLQSQILRLEQENKEKSYQREQQLTDLQSQILLLEQDSQARLQEIYDRDAKLLHLQEKVTELNKELNLSIFNKLLRKIKRAFAKLDHDNLSNK